MVRRSHNFSPIFRGTIDISHISTANIPNNGSVQLRNCTETLKLKAWIPSIGLVYRDLLVLCLNIGIYGIQLEKSRQRWKILNTFFSSFYRSVFLQKLTFVTVRLKIVYGNFVSIISVHHITRS